MIDTRIYRITGSVEPSVGRVDGTIRYPQPANTASVVGLLGPSTPSRYLVSSSIYVEGNVNARRSEQRDLYNRVLTLRATRGEIGQILPELTASEFTAHRAEPPSWTQYFTGNNQSFVIGTFSGSHEINCLNLYRSGSEILESGSLGASRDLYYVKNGPNYKQLICKMSASTDLSASFTSGLGVKFNCNTTNPAIFTVDVPQKGIIRDIKVWVEVVQQSGTSIIWSGVQSLGIALRSPNVRGFGWAHPVLNGNIKPRNSEAVQPGIYPFYEDTYLLWEGSNIVLGGGFSENAVIRDFYSWNKDTHIRTVFSDGASTDNPRMWDRVYGGNSQQIGSLDFSHVIPSGSPSWNNHHDTDGTTGALHPENPFSVPYPVAGFPVYGLSTPWIADVRLGTVATPGTFDPAEYAYIGSPPAGWLTGPGNGAAYGEFVTQGHNIGATSIKPHYPLLENITETVIHSVYGNEVQAASYINRNGVFGTRPGLRGTEMSGSWQLLLVTQRSGAFNSNIPNAYFRQFRLEFVYEDSYGDLRFPINSRRKKHRRSSSVPVRANNSHRLRIMSGFNIPTTSYTGADPPPNDAWISMITYQCPEEYGRSYGITDNTGSSAEFAVFTRLTGSYADYLTGSQHASLRYMFLHNEFGTPFISLVSGSGEPVTLQHLTHQENTRRVVSGLINPRPLLSSGNTLRSHMAGKSINITTRARAAQLTSGSST